MGRFTIQDEGETFQILLGNDTRGGRDRSPWLEIGFTIQVLCLYEAHPFRVGSGKDNNVSRNLLVIPQYDEVSNFELLPESAFPLGLTAWPSPVINGAES